MKAMFRWTRHLSEEQLFECYLAERGGEGLDPPSAEHLADCRKCHAQYTQLLGFMNGMWADADAETAGIFTADRLRVQQEEIARRLEFVGQSGRVLNFKSGSDTSRISTHAAPAISRFAAGLIAAAAAAGLVVGVGAGMLYDRGSRVPASGGTPAIARPVQAPAPVQVTVPLAPAPNDNGATSELEAVELEAVLQRPRTPELRMFDVITPHARDISYVGP
jgi:hypothetical protein